MKSGDVERHCGFKSYTQRQRKSVAGEREGLLPSMCACGSRAGSSFRVIVAQSAERSAVNRMVEGSSPSDDAKVRRNSVRDTAR